MKEKGQIVELEIDALAYGGSGVGREADGQALFVPGTVPGEYVRAQIRKVAKGFCRAIPLEILRNSQSRLLPDCPLAAGTEGLAWHGVCAGCSYRHISYKMELEWKQRQLRDFLTKAGISETEKILQAPFASPLSREYRNKMVLHAAVEGTQRELGYYGYDNRTVIDVAACPLSRPEINECLGELRLKPGFFHSLRDGMKLSFRHNPERGVTCWRGKAVKKESWLKEKSEILGYISVPVDSFYQVNPGLCEELVRRIITIVRQKAPKSFVDLYCGCGLFSLAAKFADVDNISGIDSDPGSIAAANYNLHRAGAQKYQFTAANCDSATAGILRSTGAGDGMMILVDPPRAGLAQRVVEAIGRQQATTVVYISCGPDTMTRDIIRLHEYGYRPEQISLLDMFPRTYHFESLAVLALDQA